MGRNELNAIKLRQDQLAASVPLTVYISDGIDVGPELGKILLERFILQQVRVELNGRLDGAQAHIRDLQERVDEGKEKAVKLRLLGDEITERRKPLKKRQLFAALQRVNDPDHSPASSVLYGDKGCICNPCVAHFDGPRKKAGKKDGKRGK